MTREQLVEFVNEWAFYASCFGITAEIVNGRWPEEQLVAMSRAILELACNVDTLRARVAKLDSLHPAACTSPPCACACHAKDPMSLYRKETP